MSILGTNSIIDISQHQGHPNFRTIKDAGIVGVIHKATEGVGFHDGSFTLPTSRRRRPKDCCGPPIISAPGRIRSNRPMTHLS